MWRIKLVFWFFLVSLCFCIENFARADKSIKPSRTGFDEDALELTTTRFLPRNELTKLDRKNDFIFLNTIDGTLYAVDKNDGKIKWFLKEEAVLKFPKDYKNPYFLTDPRDGSLYVFTGQQEGALKKFPYTIAELVSASPSKSADGFLYTGDKKDQWLAIDYRTGNKLDTLTSDTLASKISIADENIIYIGRTQYTISMFDVNTRRKIFNLTYYDYSTHATKSKVSIVRPSPSPKGKTNAGQEHDPNSYPYYHFSSSSDGTLITLDRRNGQPQWHLKLEHPIVAMYRYENEQLFKINFAIFSIEALTNLAEEPIKYDQLFKLQKIEEQESSNLSQQQQQQKKNTPSKIPSAANLFVSTLYVGFYKNNLYALPSFIYNWQVPLLEGSSQPTKSEENGFTVDLIDSALNNSTDEQVSALSALAPIVIGHHKLPDKIDLPPNYIQPNSKLIVISNKDNNYENFASMQELFFGKQQPLCLVENEKPNRKQKKGVFYNLWKKFDNLMQNRYVWSMFTVLVASLFPIIKTVHDWRKKKRRQLLKQQQQVETGDSTGTTSDEEEESNDMEETSTKHQSSNSSSKNSSRKLKTSSKSEEKSSANKKLVDSDQSGSESDLKERYKTEEVIHNVMPSNLLHLSMSMPEINAEGLIRIGKICYDPRQVLGHGCAGTSVYKGTFENRKVAVKRLLPECYTLADREVELLRDADQHPNVLRYFCTESDSQFRYIALELCQMTLYDYVHKHVNNADLKLRPLSILEQAAKGLHHLHSLDIVHRDIKPQNVLISLPDAKGQVNIMISDFGLCKRLEMGINSFSKRSGITGTDGWIAAELIDEYIAATSAEQNNAPKRITKSVDVFSMGCVYYFVLSGGVHPFGDAIRRQANIVNNEYKLDKFISTVASEIYMQRLLIEKMISHDPKTRPTANELIAHPVFWSKTKSLQFLQDVSDRIEKIEPDDPIVIELEKSALITIKNNWKTHICPQLQNDLRKFRTYNGVSVRDLLRAIRNKKHHYRELPPEVKQSLGALPDEFIDYFTTRFPKLILHVYEAMRSCANEPMLDVYYKVENQ